MGSKTADLAGPGIGNYAELEKILPSDYAEHPVDAQIVQAATKWKRMALKQFGMDLGEGWCTDMRAVCKYYFLDHDHSVYVDQWDWERVISSAKKPGVFEEDRREDLESPGGCGAVRPGIVPGTQNEPSAEPSQ